METTKHAGGRPFTIASRVGRPPKYATAMDLANVADEYFQWCDDTPVETSTRKLVGAKQTGKGSEAKSDETRFTAKRAYTLDGFCLYAGIGNWSQYKKDHSEDDEFRRVLYAIEQTIRDQQVTGSLVGMFNANIVARLNGLAEVVKDEAAEERRQTASEAIAAILGISVEQIEAK